MGAWPVPFPVMIATPAVPPRCWPRRPRCGRRCGPRCARPRWPGSLAPTGRIPNFTGAEAAAERLRAMPEWQAARTLKANPDSAQLPVRQRALEDGKTVYMAVPRLAGPEPFFALDPDHLSEPPRKAASISGASRSARRVALADLSPVDLVVMGSVAAGRGRRAAGQGRRVRRPGVRAGHRGGPDRPAHRVASPPCTSSSSARPGRSR